MRLTPLLLLASLSLFWGLNWPGMKIILAEVPVWWFRSICLLAGGSILLAVSAVSGKRWRLQRNEYRPVMLCGSFAILGWMVFSAYGVSLMPAGRASIIAFTMPLWASLIAHFVLGESLTRVRLIGLALGLLGLAVLIGPDLVILQRAPLGALFMLMAAISWATGTILIKKTSWEIPAISNVAWQLLFSAIPVTLVAALSEPFPDPAELSANALLALLYLILFPMSYCQWAYFRVVGLLPASLAAIGTLTVPLIGVYSSHLVLGESVGYSELIALILIVTALALVMLVPAWQKSRATPGV